jgi:hypothetical protein
VDVSARFSTRTAVFAANFIFFQTAWLCNLANLRYWEWITLCVGLGAHVYWVGYFYGIHKISREILWISGMGAGGWLVETFFIFAGVLRFAHAEVAPYWLVSVWVMFATTFRFSLLPLVLRPLLLAVLAPLACLSYWGGVALNEEAEFGWLPLAALLAVAGVWVVWLPFTAWIFRRYVL